jgi:serralysin
MTLQANYRDFSLAIEGEGSGLLGSSLDDYYFGKSLLFHEKDGQHAPGGGTQAAPDVVPGDTSSNVTVSVGGHVVGAIDAAGDHDWYKVTLVAGKTYTFSTLFSQGIFDTVLVLRDASGNQLADNDDANASNGYFLSEITFTATSSGTYFLDVGGFESDTGAFHLSVSRPDTDAIAGTSATTSSLTIGNSVNGTTDNTGDHDWYAVQLVAGQTYVFTTEATGGATDTDTALYLRDATGNLLSFNDDASATYSRIRFTATTTGTYYLDVGAWAEDESGDYRLKSEVAPPLQLYTFDQIAFQLTNTYWGGAQQRFNIQTGATLTVNIENLNADGQFLAREALKLWSDVSGITFTEVTGSANGAPTTGDIRFNDNQPGAYSESNFIGAFIDWSLVNVSTDWLTTSGTDLRSYSFQTYLHEIGHALGLGHAGPYNTSASFNQDAAYLNDSWATTVMSYFDQQENPYFNGLGFSNAFVQTPMIADLVAIASLYGQANNLRTGDTIYGVNNNTGRDIYTFAIGLPSVAVTIVDHGGIDTLDYSTSNANQRLDLNQEAYSNTGGSTGNVSIARGTVIENANGGNGNDVLIGNSANNRLDGGAGTDQMYGGAGNDIFVANLQGDLVFEDVGGGTDTVESSSNFYLYDNVENLTLSGSAGNFGVGNELANTLTGNSGENLLIGWGGIDTINGGAARDAIFGVEGDDILNGEAGIDYIVAGNGNDTLNGGADADEMYGQAGNDSLDGGSSFDTDIMVGGDGHDTIDGDSGLGDFDYMYGNLGDDIFYVDTPADLVFEQSGEGTDTVFANISGAGFYLYENIENLTLQGNTPFGVGNGLANTLIGNDIANFLLGGDGNDILNGKAGDDVLFGEAGNDTFVFQVGNGGDVIGDFVRGQDKIDVSAYGLSFAQLQSLFVQNGNVGAIQMSNGDLVVLHNITMSQLTASDFILGVPAEPPPKQLTVQPALADLAVTAESLYGDDGIGRWMLDHYNGAPIA